MLSFKNNKTKPRVVFYCGASGYGKTGKAVHDIRHMSKAILGSTYDTVFIFDDEENFSDRIPAYCCTTEREYIEAVASGFVCLNTDELFDDQADGCAWLCEAAFRFSCTFPGLKALFIDELQDKLDPHPAVWRKHPLAKCIRKGRKRGLHVFAIAPSMSDINPGFRQQITEIFAFQHEDEKSAEHLIKKGIPFATLHALKEGEYIYWNKRERGFKTGKVELK